MFLKDDIPFIKSILKRTSPIKITFTKVDGDRREMICTLNHDYMPPVEPGAFKDTGLSEKKPENVLTVYEMNVGWKSFRVENILSIHKLEWKMVPA